MHRRRINSTRYDIRNRKMMWRVEWVFEGAAAGAKEIDERVQEDAVLSEVRAYGLQE